MMAAKNPKPISTDDISHVIAVMTYLRSGSGLMSSLLDNHPNILATPDCLLASFYRFWDDHGNLPIRELTALFIDWYAVLFDSREESKSPDLPPDTGESLGFSNLGPFRNEYIHVSKDLFRSSIIRLIGDEWPVRRKQFFQAIHIAYAEALGRKVENPVIVFGLHTDGPLRMQGIIEDFPDVLFLQMIRDPIQAIRSHFRYYDILGQVNPLLALATMFRALYSARPNTNLNQDQWRGVRLEDLHAQPLRTMQKLCSWLRLDWDDILLSSTVNGKQWWNEKNSPQISGFDEQINSKRFQEYTSLSDRYRLGILFANRRKAWGYPVSPYQQNIVMRLCLLPLLAIPFKTEMISISTIKETTSAPLPSIKALPKILRLYATGRWFLLKAWLNLFRRTEQELQIL